MIKRGKKYCKLKDYKNGGYNLESAKANETRLNNLILLIAISYTISFF